MAPEYTEMSIEAVNFVWGMLSYTRSKQMKATTSKRKMICSFFDSSLLTIGSVACEY